MVPVIRIDDAVYQAIWQRGKDLGLPFPSPNDVLRHDYLQGHKSTVQSQANHSVSQVEITIRSIHTARRYSLIPLPKEDRHLFPGYKVGFELETDLETVTTKVTSAPRGTRIGDPVGGTRIQGKLMDWFNGHPELKDGAKVKITAIEPSKRYRLDIIGTGH